jgi:predicted transcriptional regulator
VTTSNAEPSKSIELAAEIVAAFVANNSLPIAELPALIHSVHASLEKLAGGPETSAPLVEKTEPAVSIRKSITPVLLVCLDDGKKFKSLRRHADRAPQHRRQLHLHSVLAVCGPFEL